MSATIDQKEYLKRYLSGGDDKKKKKKKKPKVGTGVKIIDDDADINKRANMNDDDIEFMFQGEDAPQVAAIIDDRPEILKNQDDPDYDKKWKGIGEDGEAAQKLLKKKKKKKSSKSDKKSTKTYSQPSDSDQSPPRINRQNNDAHRSNDRDKDNSRRRSDEDLSPPRRRRRDSDQSPPRRNGRNSPDSDLSPPRREHSEKSSRDISPPRRPRHKESQNDRHRNPRSYASNSSSLKSRKRDHDQSPPRRQARSQDGDVSPPRRRPENDPSHQKRKSRWGPEDEKSREEDTRLKTTLEGRSAGLQDAKRLAQETLDLQRREERMFEQLSDDVSGRNAKAIVRNRGKKETSAEREAQRERTKKQKEREEKYERWGKGVKQAEAQEAKVQDYMHESSKPMARYKNDSDLDHHLKQQDREGDPMLNYLRSKGRGAGPSSQSSGEVLPIYKGSYPINCFNIRPGYRWDGVDRSNGYEKKYFENKNNKIANDADAYKWSTEDM